MEGYDPTSRPVHNHSSVLTVQIAISLYHILDTVRGLRGFWGDFGGFWGVFWLRVCGGLRL